MEDASAAVLVAVDQPSDPPPLDHLKAGQGGASSVGDHGIQVQFACYAGVYRSRDPRWHPAIPLAEGETRPVNYLTSGQLEHIKYLWRPVCRSVVLGRRYCGARHGMWTGSSARFENRIGSLWLWAQPEQFKKAKQ